MASKLGRRGQEYCWGRSESGDVCRWVYTLLISPLSSCEDSFIQNWDCMYIRNNNSSSSPGDLVCHTFQILKSSPFLSYIPLVGIEWCCHICQNFVVLLVFVNKGAPNNIAVKVLVRVYVVLAKELHPQDLNGKADPYLILRIGNKVFNDKENYKPMQLSPVFGRWEQIWSNSQFVSFASRPIDNTCALISNITQQFAILFHRWDCLGYDGRFPSL